jgi:hypothetical protein
MAFDPDAFLSQPAQPVAASDSQQPQTSGFDPDAFLSNDTQERYGTTGQQVKAGLEGVAKGIAGPLAPLAETTLGITTPEDIRGRAAANPITHGLGEAAGLTGGMLTGTGEAALMSHVGEAAVGAAGLAKGAEALSFGAKVGSAVVQQAAEMAVLQGSDEVSKAILNDPDFSAQSAIANIGLSAALGGATGGFISGAVSPLWNATAGPKVDALLGMIKNHVDGGAGTALSEAGEAALKDLGIELDPAMRAGMSENQGARQTFGTLRRAENSSVLDSIDKLHSDASQSVMNSLGLNAEDVANHSENEAGHDLLDTFKKEYDSKYQPIAEQLQKRDEEAAGISIPDKERLNQYSGLIEKGMSDVGTDSPYYKLYDEYGQRLLAKDTIGGVDKLKTEINNRIKGLKIGGDYNVINALNDIKGQLTSFQENQIALAGRESEKAGIEGASKSAKDLLAERAATNKSYANFSNMSDELTNHLGIGDFRGAGTLKGKLTDKIAPEDLLKKFSIRGNSDFIPFLQKNFPDTLTKVLENERKQLVKPAILSAAKKGENPVDVKKLSDIIQKGMAGKKDYIEAVLPKDAISKVESAKTLLNAVPTPRDSGTPAGLSKIFSMMPTSAMAAVGWLTGHGPIASLLFGETANRLGKDVPEAIKLAHLKYLGSNQPIKSEGFKAMVDFFHATAKGQNALAKGAKAVLESGAKVLTESQMPNKADREKLDKQVSKIQENPQELIKSQQGSVGHYLPQHQVALSQASTQAVQYLGALKPHPQQPGPLNRVIEPTPAQNARYNRALDIAINPAVVLQHVKDGTIKPSDLMDLKGMYPAYYQQMSQKLTNEMMNAHSNAQNIPYKTKIGISLLLGQPLDSSMTPTSIQSAQIALQPKQGQQQQNGTMKNKKGTSSLGKSNDSYKTASQSAESDRTSRD